MEKHVEWIDQLLMGGGLTTDKSSIMREGCHRVRGHIIVEITAIIGELTEKWHRPQTSTFFRIRFHITQESRTRVREMRFEQST